MKQVLSLIALLLALPAAVYADEWVRTNQPLWGLQNGLQFALYPAGFNKEESGPRGLIRVGAPVLPDGGHTLVNFIAVEPVVKGKKGLSELEWSQLDSTQGKRFWTDEPKRSSPSSGVEQLDVPVNIEAFANGARIRLIVSQRSDTASELRFTVHTQPGSAPIEMCILTATMGNWVRARQLWLRDEVLNSLKLWPDFHGSGFTPHTIRPLERLARTASGDVITAITGNEPNPAAVFPFPGSRRWWYPGVPVTQYWKVPKMAVSLDLCVAVNGRTTYWQSGQLIPGSVAFENFEMRARFHEGQQFIFGVTRRQPSELGITNHIQSQNQEK